MRGMDIFQKPYYREIGTMRGRPMRGLPVLKGEMFRTEAGPKQIPSNDRMIFFRPKIF